MGPAGMRRATGDRTMRWTLIPLALILTACDGGPAPHPKTGSEPNPAFQAQIQAIEKARAVDGQVTAAAQAQRKQIDDATQQ